MSLNQLLQATWYPILFDTPLNAFRSTVIWLTLALTIGFLIGFFVIKQDKRKLFLKISLVFFVIYALIIGLTFIIFKFFENAKEGTLITLIVLPISILIILIAITGIIIKLKCKKIFVITSSLLTVISFIATLVCLSVHFLSGKGAELNWITNNDVNSLMLIISAILLTGIIIVIGFLTDKTKLVFDTSSITYASCCIAMSFALSYLRIVKMPQGGSITIGALLPIMLYSYMFGTKKGVFAGMVYGLLQAVQDPYILHPAQFILDYPLAFSCIGIAGMFANTKFLQKIPQLQFAIGALIAGLFRFLMHFISGVFAFSAFADGQNPYIYSLVYQASYVLPDLFIAIILGASLFSVPSFLKLIKAHTVKQ